MIESNTWIRWPSIKIRVSVCCVFVSYNKCEMQFIRYHRINIFLLYICSMYQADGFILLLSVLKNSIMYVYAQSLITVDIMSRFSQERYPPYTSLYLSGALWIGTSDTFLNFCKVWVIGSDGLKIFINCLWQAGNSCYKAVFIQTGY